MRYFVAFWNLENLFAPEGHPGREPWIANAVKDDLKGWTEALFDTKIAQLASVIAEMNGGKGPDLLGVCEVEMKFCLERVAGALNAALPARRYGIVHADSTKDRRGIDTAFLYDGNTLTPNLKEFFSHFVLRRTGTRDISQVTFTTLPGHEFVAFANHWPSRSGGYHTLSAGFRMTAGETLGYWHARVLEEKGEVTPVIAFGDFNDDPADPSLMLHALAVRERDDVVFGNIPLFYNLAWSYLRQSVTNAAGKTRDLYGTLYYENDANLFDQILVSKRLLGKSSPVRVLEDTARIVAPARMVSTSKNEGPIRFGLPRGNAARNVNTSGFSDHFPVSVEIEVDDAIA